ncbi:hypothetical protein FRC04_001548 [Tulasnella sp. 424]|nr:hypothetical protein FRC04_001548 [Tulasnella sp. 424]
MKETLNRSEVERLAGETAAQAFGVGFNDLDSFITQQCESRGGSEVIGTLDLLLGCFSRYRNRLLRVELLPDDILLDIFSLAVNFDELKNITRSTDLPREMRIQYRNLCSIQRVEKRWHDIIVSYAPFWSLICASMPQNAIELALTRAKQSPLCIRAQYDEEEGAGHFMDMVLPMCSRIRSLILDLGHGGEEMFAPLWMRLPAIQRLQVVYAEDIPYQASDKSSPTHGIPSPHWIHLIDSALPTVSILYAQVEELTLERPSVPLTCDVLKSIVLSAPRLRILRLEMPRLESLNDESPVDPMPVPNLQLLCILCANGDEVSCILDWFQLSPSTSIQITARDAGDMGLTPYEGQIRSLIWSALRSTTEPSFCLDLAPWAYKFQIGESSIEIEGGYHNTYPQWPDFFKGFVPRAGQAPLRVYVFLTATLGYPGEFPNQDCLAGLHNDSFVMM